MKRNFLIWIACVVLMMLAASKGCDVEICATGRQADEALDSLQALIDDKFGEGE